MAKPPKPSPPDAPADLPENSGKTIEMILMQSMGAPESAHAKPPTETIRADPPIPPRAVPRYPSAR